MESLKIKPTQNSLEVSLDAETGKLIFSGRSYPENSPTFFKPIIEWVQRYVQSPAPKTECSFTIEYFNSASRKSVMELFKVIERLHKTTGSVTILWNYEEDDETMRETGEEYKNIFKLDFKFNPY